MDGPFPIAISSHARSFTKLGWLFAFFPVLVRHVPTRRPLLLVLILEWGMTQEKSCVFKKWNGNFTDHYSDIPNKFEFRYSCVAHFSMCGYGLSELRKRDEPWASKSLIHPDVFDKVIIEITIRQFMFTLLLKSF